MSSPQTMLFAGLVAAAIGLAPGLANAQSCTTSGECACDKYCNTGSSTCVTGSHPDGTAGLGCSGLCRSGSCFTGCYIGGAWYVSGDPNPANPCQICDPASPTAWSPVGGTPACASDGNPCTDDRCSVAGLCLHTTLPDGTTGCSSGATCHNGACATGCYVSGTWRNPGEQNPVNACQLCAPASSTSAWSNAPVGAACASDANACTDDVCNAGGTCSHVASINGVTCAAGKVCNAGICSDGCWIDGSFYAANQAHPANPCLACKPGMSTTQWTAVNEAVATGCGAAAVCHLGVCTSGCGIAGAYYSPGETNPGSSCQQCTPSTTTTAWSSVAEGTGCGSGQYCHSGTCASGCWIAATFYAAAEPNPANACLICAPGTNPTAWSSVADGASCATGRVCDSGACASKCWIGGQLWAAAASNPANLCQICTPASATTAWSSAPTGTACADDGFACTDDECDAFQACQHPDKPNGTSCGSGMICNNGQCGSGCDIASVHYGSGQVNPANPCQACEPASSLTAWSAINEAADCGGANVCHAGACVEGCGIGGAYFAKDAPNPANGCELCAPSKDNGAWSAAAATVACADDGNLCTADACNGNGTCAHSGKPAGTSCDADKVCYSGVCLAGCWIANGFIGAGGVNPSNSCQTCQPDVSISGWTSSSVGATCADDGDPCTDDACDAAPTCKHVTRPEQSTCGADKYCFSTVCSPGCLIDGTARREGEVNASNACEVCAPAAAADAWSKAPVDTLCPDDGNPCTSDLCLADGTCDHPMKADGTPCGTSGETCAGGVCPCSATETACGDLVDNDCNGKTDCQEPGCGNQACNPDDKCVVDAKCTATACVGTTVTCTEDRGECWGTGACNKVTGECDYPYRDQGTPCTGTCGAGSGRCDGLGVCISTCDAGVPGADASADTDDAAAAPSSDAGAAPDASSALGDAGATPGLDASAGADAAAADQVYYGCDGCSAGGRGATGTLLLVLLLGLRGRRRSVERRPS